MCQFILGFNETPENARRVVRYIYDMARHRHDKCITRIGLAERLLHSRKGFHPSELFRKLQELYKRYRYICWATMPAQHVEDHKQALHC